MKIQCFAATDVGRKRSQNEDNFIASEDLSLGEWDMPTGDARNVSKKGSLLFVADGMGGTNAGEVASAIATETIEKYFSDLKSGLTEREILTGAIVSCHAAIVERQRREPDKADMGTTAVIAWIVNDKLHVAWSGDSRVYLIRTGKSARPLTNDHSIVWDMVMSGILTAEEARNHPDSNQITQCLGGSRPPKPNYLCETLSKGDTVLLCSDGLNGMLPDEDIFTSVLNAETPGSAVRSLIAAANQHGGKDNITVIACRILALDKHPSRIAPAIGLMLMVLLAVGGWWWYGNTSDNTALPEEIIPKPFSVRPLRGDSAKSDVKPVTPAPGKDNEHPLSSEVELNKKIDGDTIKLEPVLRIDTVISGVSKKSTAKDKAVQPIVKAKKANAGKSKPASKKVIPDTVIRKTKKDSI